MKTIISTLVPLLARVIELYKLQIHLNSSNEEATIQITFHGMQPSVPMVYFIFRNPWVLLTKKTKNKSPPGAVLLDFGIWADVILF